MGHRDDKLTSADLEAAEAATRLLLARWDEPQPVPTPAGLPGRVLAALPTGARYRAPRRRPSLIFGAWLLSAVVALLLGIGAWGVWLNSAGPAGLLGRLSAGMAGLILELTLMAKPLLNLLGASAGLGLVALVALLAGGAIWWRLVLATLPSTALEQPV